MDLFLLVSCVRELEMKFFDFFCNEKNGEKCYV